MNKKLYVQVKDLCKDNGLSEKYLQAITEKMGGNLTDDSTDEEIEKVANLIAEVAKETQGEATRWAKNKTTKKETDDDDDDDDNDGDGESKKKRKKGKSEEDPNDARIKALEQELAEMKADRQKGERAAQIAAAMEKHNIPAKFRDRLAKSIADDADIEEAVSGIKQDFITEGLMTEDVEGRKAASEKQIDEAAQSLLDSITVK